MLSQAKKTKVMILKLTNLICFTEAREEVKFSYKFLDFIIFIKYY